MGKFIVFEGIDGSGQSTHSKLLAEYLQKKGYKVWLTKEPRKDSEIGSLIRKILNKEIKFNNLALQLLMMADRVYHVEEIKEKLKENYFVISDRYFFSTIAYGSLESEIFYETFKQFNKKFFLLPDYLIILDLDPKIAFERISGREKREVFEELLVLERVRNFYKKIYDDFKGEIKILIINSNDSIEKVSEKIRNFLGL